MIGKIVQFSLRQRILVLILGAALVVAGSIAFKSLPIEAYPDIADTWVQIITQWPGHAAEEVEQQITVPLEIVMNSVPHHIHLRSVSLFGLSVVTMIFDEQTDTFTARMYALEKIAQAQLPPGITPVMGPMGSPVGQIYWYFLDSKRPVVDLKDYEDWELEKRLKSVPGVADVSSFGGEVKQYQVLANPLSLANYGLNTASIITALAANNQNSGGGFIQRGDQALNVRGVGKADNVDDIQNVIITQKSGTPIRIRNIGQVVTGHQERLGQISMSAHRPDGSVDARDDVVEGIILSRVGEKDETVLKEIRAKVKEINEKVLPSDVKIRPYLDRTDLIEMTTRTVEHNMVEGMILVLLVLLFFLGNIRSAIIVTITVPLALLFASILLNVGKIPANLLSLGALDFGMVVDGAVVMVENIFRHKQQAEERGEDPRGMDFIRLILGAAREVERPIVYAIAIIILAYLPIFTLERIEGKLFTPMAWTVTFALLGAMLLAITVVPVLCSFFLEGKQPEWHNPWVEKLRVNYREYLVKALDNRRFVMWVALGSFALTVFLAFGGPIGSEFLPHLDEGSLWVRGTLPPSTGLNTANDVVKKARAVFMQFPEVPMTVCQVGRPDDGTDATGFFNTECFVDLKQRGEWRSKFHRKEDVVDAINLELSKIPGVVWNFSQPISDNVEEMMSGVKGSMVVKLYGEDLKVLEQKAHQIEDVLGTVKGVDDLGVFDENGQPNINISIDRDKISRYGLNISDVQDMIETAVGGKVATQVVEGEKRFDLIVRFQPQYRSDVEQIKKILVATPDGYRIPIEDLATVKTQDGASMIYREENSRYIAVKFSVRDRDLGSTIEDAQRAVKRKVLLPSGYSLGWSGEFESERRAEHRLAIIVPMTILAIFVILFFVFGSLKWSSIIMVNVAIALVGGVVALFLTGTNFSVSSGIGFLAVFGVSIQTGILLVSYINQMRVRGMGIREAIVEGASLRLRPILMTGLVATFGLLPAAFSHAIGSDSQRPLAIVVVGGMITDLVIGFFLLPVLYEWFAKSSDDLAGSESL
jgi:cobalt-zinc-cadmium resistance protein CzcA